jgi:crotonobetainyl-CoA:carnitine CoA-transferase CaiB-like acyl-CoA transferase
MPYGKEGSLTLPNSPLHLSGTPTVVGKTMPGHGEDTGDILGGWLGLPADAIARLREKGVVA